MTPVADLLARLERYYDAAPRAGARTEAVGPFTLFVSDGTFPFYARPRLGLADVITVPDVVAVLARQRELGVPEAIEWVTETTPSLAAAARTAGLTVEELPLLVLERLVEPPIPAGVRVRRITADEPEAAMARIMAIAPLAFGDGGTAAAGAGPAERDARAATDTSDRSRLRERLASGAAVLVVAEDADGPDGPLASGVHQPIDGVTEIVAVATLPAARRRGLASAVTAALAADARSAGVATVYLSASAEAVARIYERLGFRRAATAGVAERGKS